MGAASSLRTDPSPQVSLLAGYVSQGGLIWMPVTTKATWAIANSYCANATIDDQTSWRMSTKDELVSLGKSGVLADAQGWMLKYGAWSSTPHGACCHDYVNLDIGHVDKDLDVYYHYVSCVR